MTYKTTNTDCFTNVILLITAVIFLFPSTVTANEKADKIISNFVTETATDDLLQMKKRKVIRALVSYSLTDFFIVDGRLMGNQKELLDEYEKFINKDIKKEQDKTRIVYVPVSFDQLITNLIDGKGDIAASMLTITPSRKEKVDFIAGDRNQVVELVVTNSSVKIGDSLDDLSGRTAYVLRGSSYVEHLVDLNQHFATKGLNPIIIIEADSHITTEDILELVNAGAIELTIVDDFKAELWAKVLKNITVHKDLKVDKPSSIGWAVRKENTELQKSLKIFVNKVKKGTLLGNILFKRYYENVRWIKNPTEDSERDKLNKYIKLFEKYGDKFGFDYLALCAQAYQESELDHNRKSSRGAVGLMQLLTSTASDPNVGIPNIDDPEQNIHAGAKYLAFLRDRYFSDPAISQEDRLAFTWAAYNAGPAKVIKMRKLAKEMGLDSNKWFSNVEFAAGKIVGRETVKYVANIYKYYIAYSLIKNQLDLKRGGNQT